MKLLFWLSLSLIFLAYAGYPIYLYFRAKFWPRPIRRASIFPTVTIVIAVYNEAKTIPGRLLNLTALEYPQDRFEVIIVSDGSTDGTNDILTAQKKSNLQALILPKHVGKAVALNHAIAAASGEIICFMDSRQTIALDGLKNLMESFADPSVGCVSGELILCTNHANQSANISDGVGLYWRLEKYIRNCESLAGSTVGATGAFYAVRRGLVSLLPADTILDDVYIPLQVARQGWRVVFEPRALVWDYLPSSPTLEFRRKLRTLSGNYQLLRLAPWALSRSNPLLFQFICHKLLRLLVPFGLICLLLTTYWLRQGVYGLLLILQGIFYSLAGLTMLRLKNTLLSQLSNVSLTFIVLNAAAAVALMQFITGRKVEWERTDRLQADNPRDFLRSLASQGRRQAILTSEPESDGVPLPNERLLPGSPHSPLARTEPSDSLMPE